MSLDTIRTAYPVNLYLLRHTEAYKNLHDVHGGGDQRLTPVGRYQAKTLGSYLLDVCTESLQIVHQPEGRSKVTAQRIGMIASRSIIEMPELVGVGLGVVSGLSQKELEAKHPEVAAAISAWRANKGSLSQRPRVPGSEHMEDFANRIHCGLSKSVELCGPSDSLAIVGTTSTLNMMNHLLINDGKFIRPLYDFVEFPLGSLTTWQLSLEPPRQIMPITTLNGNKGVTA